MNRAAALAYLTAEFGASTNPYLTLAGVTIEDDGPVAGIIDTALLRLGTAYADLATAAPTNALAYRATLRYEALVWLWNNINDLPRSAKVGAGQGVSVDATYWRSEFAPKIELARKDAAAQGVNLPSLTSDGLIAAAYASGITRADVQARERDTGLVAPFFSRTTGSNPPGYEQEYRHG